MRILFNISHPAHVHLFKNAIWNLKNKGHSCLITAVDKDVSLHLLDSYGFDYEVVGSSRHSLLSKAIEMLMIECRLSQISRLFKPDILIGGVGNPYVVHVGKFIGKPSLIFDDTENDRVGHFLLDSIADFICTPSCYRKTIGKNQVLYEGYHEIAYLHPNYFTPDPSVLDEIGLSIEDRYVVLRFVSWDSIHDLGHYGLTMDDKEKAIFEFEKRGHVLISSEGQLPNKFARYKIKLSPEKIHHLLYYATLFYGDSATMASECAVMGTHSIYCDYTGRGYTDEEEKRFGLVYNFHNGKTMGNESLKKALELLENPNLRFEGKIKRERLLNEKIDLTEFMIGFIEKFAD